jgi:nucleoporin POM152
LNIGLRHSRSLYQQILPAAYSAHCGQKEHAITMNGTPRLRSAFPSTPGSGGRGGNPRTVGSPSGSKNGGIQRTSPLPNVPSSGPTPTSAPLIPITLVDAPTQRMYTVAVYCLLIVWRLYDWWTLVEAETTSLPLFGKWFVIDLAFLYGVPMLRIPWLEWSDSTAAVACILHQALNWMLMFRIPVCTPKVGCKHSLI